MKILEVNYTDLAGKRFNGYDLIEDLKNHNIKLKVLDKYSKNISVVNLFNNSKEYYIYLKLLEIEKKNSLQGVFSITSQILLNSKEYKEADKIHLHSLANCKMSLYSLIRINEEKELILSFHDPWYLTGRCVHFFECDKWKSGCKKCLNLNTHYPLKEDNCNILWKLKKNIFKNINPKIIIPSKWMKDLINTSTIIEKNKNINLIPFGINIDKFKKREIKKLKYNIDNDQIVIFFRAENNFKGTEYIVEALKKFDNLEKITIITCGQKGLLHDLKNKCKIIEYGFMNEEILIDIYSISDIFLMPSTGESFGLMAIEAMSCKCPIIVFKNTALENVVDAPSCGLAAEYKDAESLYEKIKYLIDNKNERIIRGQKGREIVEKKYNINLYLKRINKLYTEPIKKDNNKKYIKSSTDNNLLFFLNNITNNIFSKNKKIIQKLKYECCYSEGNIDYSDLSIQKTIYDYCEKLYKTTENENFRVPIIVKVKFWLKKHRKIQKFIISIIRK